MNNKNLQVVIPLAGRGQRFNVNGYQVPKPLIDIHGVTMIEAAVKSLGLIKPDGFYTFITLKYEEEELNKRLNDILFKIAPKAVIIPIDHVTEGPACSVLEAKKFIDNDKPLVVANCDQIMKWDDKAFLSYIEAVDADGVVVTYKSNTPKNSYIEIDPKTGYGIRLAEKEVISEYSLNGIHYWKHGSDFVRSAEKMIEKDIRVNNEFYVSMTYNELIAEGKEICRYGIKAENHHAVGVPEDLERYLNENK